SWNALAEACSRSIAFWARAAEGNAATVAATANSTNTDGDLRSMSVLLLDPAIWFPGADGQANRRLGHAAHRAGRRPAQRLTDDRVLLFAGIAFDVMAQAAENARAVMHDLAAAALDQDAPAALDDLADPLVVQAFEVQHLQGRVKILEREHRAQAASRLELAGSDEKHLQAGLAGQPAHALAATGFVHRSTSPEV